MNKSASAVYPSAGVAGIHIYPVPCEIRGYGVCHHIKGSLSHVGMDVPRQLLLGVESALDGAYVNHKAGAAF